MNGVVSGAGDVSQMGAGVTTIATAQAYTGLTTISAGTLALSGSGNIISSRNVIDNGIFSIAEATGGASIQSLSGGGAVQLGGQTLTLTNASGSFSGYISGAGGLTLAGGKESLSGASTYTGPTTIAAGTLLLSGPNSLAASTVVDNAALDISMVSNTVGANSTSIASLSGSGTVALGTNTLNLTNAADTFSGTMSGTGGLKISGGTEILSGANTYTGTTTIAAGNLALSAAGSLAATSKISVSGLFDISAATSSGPISLASLSGSGTVNLGAQSLNLTNASDVFSGTIMGTGGLTVSGGTQILAGMNSYTGGTAISAGTLQIGNGSGGSIIGGVADNGTLAFGGANSSAFAGVISGSGAVIQNGIGTTSLTAANNYTGGTTIQAGTLQIGNGGASGSIVGDVVDNGTLAFGRSDTTIFNGTVSGTGGISLVSGTTILTAVESYSGATIINGNAGLALAGGGSIAASGGVTDNGTFDVSAATTAPQIASLAGAGSISLGNQSLTLTNASDIFSGTIAGSGNLVVNKGTETLTGANSYTGSTTVNGVLLVNGSIASSSRVTVLSGGTLAGTGTVPSVTLADGSTLAPGVSGSGTLHVAGSVAFSNSGNFLVNVSSASSSALATSGPDQLAGTLSVVSTDGTYPLDQKLTILTSQSGVTGSFNAAPIPSQGATFAPKLSYDANDVYLQINLAKLSPLLPADATRNEAGPVNGIDTAIASGSVLNYPFQNLGNDSSAGLAADADQMSGELGSDLPLVGRSLMNPFLDSIFNHMGDGQLSGKVSGRGPQQQDANIWATAFKGASIFSADQDTGAHKFKSSIVGISGGADFQVSQQIRLGGSLSIGSSDFHLADDLGAGTATAVQAAAYGLVHFNARLYGAFAGAVALDTIATNRALTVSGADDLTASVKAKIVSGRYESGLNLGWATPYIAVQDELTALPAYSENASSGADTFALAYDSRTANDASLELGLRQSGDIITTKNWTLRMVNRFAWSYSMSGGSAAQAAFEALPSSSFSVYGANTGRNTALFSFGAELESKRGFNVNLRLDSGISANSQTYNGMAGIAFNW
jgi:autotransporter-associated beta strand protein